MEKETCKNCKYSFRCPGQECTYYCGRYPERVLKSPDSSCGEYKPKAENINLKRKTLVSVTIR